MSDDRPYRDEEWLYEKYVEQRLPPREIANLCNTTKVTIEKWCERFGFTTLHRDPDWLREQYWEHGRSTPEMGEMARVHQTTVCDYMDEHGIERRGDGREPGEGYHGKRYRDAGWLREKYVEEGLDTETIGELCGVTGRTIEKWCDRHDIQTRGGGPT